MSAPFNLERRGYVNAALLAAAGVAPAAHARGIPLKLCHSSSPSDSRHLASELFARKVAQYTEGRYRVLVFHSAQLGADVANVAQVVSGDLDFTVSAPGNFASLVPTLNLTLLPYLVSGYEHGWRLYDESPWIARQFAELPAKGIRNLAVWEAGFRSFSTKAPLVTPADAKGKKIRIYANEMLGWIMQSLGYEPVVMPLNDVYVAIKQGRVEGQENPIDTIQASRFFEVSPNITLTQHVYSPLQFVGSEKLWQRLSVNDREAMVRAAREAAVFSREFVRQSELRQLDEMRAKGALVTTPNVALFRAATEPVYERARQKYGADVDAVVADAKRLSVGARP